jgi:hypothetical protein
MLLGVDSGTPAAPHVGNCADVPRLHVEIEMIWPQRIPHLIHGEFARGVDLAERLMQTLVVVLAAAAAEVARPEHLARDRVPG